MNNPEKMTYPRITIVIVNWNGLEDTEECLESLKKITYPDYKVIVVDNGSKGDDARVLEKKFPEYIHVIRNDKNDGYAAGANIGARQALANFDPDYICFLNNDIVVDPLFLIEMVKIAETDADIGIVGCKIYFYSEPTRLQAVWGEVNLLKGDAVPTPSTKTGIKEADLGQYDSIKTVEWVTGCCTLVRRKVLDTIGFIDESYFFYWEDVDYCFGAKKSGFRTVYVPTAKVWHKLGQSSNKIAWLGQYYYFRNRFLFMRKHATKSQFFTFLVYIGFFSCLASGYYILHFRFDRLATYYIAIWDGMRGCTGARR
jgi:GT2 family glycosyltransferase